jgi:hypothetical protein
MAHGDLSLIDSPHGPEKTSTQKTYQQKEINSQEAHSQEEAGSTKESCA